MGKAPVVRRGKRGSSQRSFQVTSLERRLLMCVEHLQNGHLPEDLGTFGVHLDVPRGADTLTDWTATSTGIAAAPLTAVPVLSSRPGAAAKLYLDFDGDVTSTWGQFAPGTTPAYDQDGLATSFSSGEVASIQEIWSRVAEKYSPFNVDVTTVDPGNLNNYQTARVVLGGSGAWLGAQAGGVAYVGGFYNYAPNTSFVFTKNLGNGYAQYAAEAAAHESGHTFGLQHQGQWSGTTLVSEYNPGTNTTAPIMGNSYTAPRGLWWRGTPSTSATAIQDDMAVLGGTLNRFGYRADDFGGTIATATQLTLSNNAFSTKGIIERTTDWDYFKFDTGAGTVSFDAATLAKGATLDLQLGLFNSTGTPVASANTTSLGEKLFASVAAGTYYLGVASRGNYGDVGQYTLSGTVAPLVTPPATPTSLNATSASHSQIDLAWNDVATETGYRVERSTDGVNWALVGTTAANVTTFRDTALAAQTTYRYRVLAQNVSGTSAPSAVATTTTLAAPAPAVSASFVRSDATTRGQWKGVYGADGYTIIGDSSKMPAYATIAAAGHQYYLWSSGNTWGALQRGSVDGYLLATWYTADTMTIDLNVTDGKEHQFTLYMIDYYTADRRQKIEVVRASDGVVLDTRSPDAPFSNGVHMSWNVKGHVQFRITRTGGMNAVVSGLFFDPAATTTTATLSSSGTATNTSTADTTTTTEPTGTRTTSRRREVAVFSTRPIAVTTAMATTVEQQARPRQRRAFDLGVRDRVTL